MKVLVIGSSNTDMVIKTSRIPVPGETIIGGSFFMNQGGKGANQAITAARLGAQVGFVCKLGTDLFGKQAEYSFEKEGIDTSYVFSDFLHPTGVALILVDNAAENCIVVAPGANYNLLPEDIDRAEGAFMESDIILIQLEIPFPTVEHALKLAYRLRKRVILNPAPARSLSGELLKCVYIITPNETEAEILSGIKIRDEASVQKAAAIIHGMGVAFVIITLGSKGAYIYDGQNGINIPAFRVKAVDTTAAGDVFNGALAVGLSENMTLPDAVRFACKASSISVTREGAQSSIPYRKEVIM